MPVSITRRSSLVATRKLGKYEVIERLGRGGMAEVYRAYHQSLDRFVAIKVLHAFLADDPDFKDRFSKEARNIAKLRHPNIVQVYDFENDPASESYFMVMELIEGETLKDLLTEVGARGEHFSLPDSLRMTREAASALAYAHGQGMIHRDVKPANLMIDKDNRVVLTDFGIAKIVTGAQFTASGGMIGTPAYMAPEQGLGDQGDERSDLYSLGVILYQLVTGRQRPGADRRQFARAALDRRIGRRGDSEIERVVFVEMLAGWIDLERPLDAFEIGDQGVGGLITIIRLLGHQLHDHLIDGIRDIRLHDAGRRDRFVQVLEDGRQRRLGLKRQPTGDQLIEDDAERIQIAAFVALIA
jgi:serine/threonine protein kinase